MLKSQLEQQAKAVDTILGNMRVLESKLAEVCRTPVTPAAGWPVRLCARVDLQCNAALVTRDATIPVCVLRA